ncbi:MAG: N-acetylglucosamine-6-phosphate deacetylase [Phycisphaerae bacterium]|nr:N-acetylglucosamine-6-phosphate deacetylase [Phycisphaerae bacterium]
MTDNKDELFFDLQVNGYGGVDFNRDDLSSDDLQTACEALRADGVGGIFATIITENIDSMARRLANLAALRDENPLAREMIVGLHVEGPFINPTDGYRGAHPLDAVRPADADTMARLLDAGGGLVKIVTLAPECDKGLKVTRMLAKSGVTVSAGHCDPSLDELKAAVDAGLGMFTHLGNGCPMQMHRHDNIVQRALSLSDSLWLTFIADGAHIPFPTLGNYIRAAGLDRCVIVTDAIAPAGLGPGKYSLGRWELTIGDDMVARSPDESHLVGAAISMPQSLANLIKHVGLSRQDAMRLITSNPAAAIT